MNVKAQMTIKGSTSLTWISVQVIVIVIVVLSANSYLACLVR
ncbi:hypothetical protein [Streptomyces apocyni]|nr:hypothetical protein [Streptomyces apocyni]